MIIPKRKKMPFLRVTGTKEGLSDSRGTLYEVTRSYFNSTGMDITVTSREGLKVLVPNQSSPDYDDFVIRDTYVFKPELISELNDFFQHGEMISAELEVLKDVYLKHTRNPRNKLQPLKVFLDVSLRRDDLAKLCPFYVNNRDVTLSIGGIDTAEVHPFSRPEYLVQYFERMAKGDGATSFTIELVDNESTISDRYMLFGGRLMEIKPMVDVERESAAYFIEYSADGSIDVKIFPLDELEEKLGLYKTREEAISAGDVKALRQEEIAKVQHDLQLKSVELANLQAEYKKKEMAYQEEVLNAKRSLGEIEIENKRLKAELDSRKAALDQEMASLKADYERKSMAEKDYYESRSHMRKDSSEIWKFVAPLAVGALGAFALL